MHKIVHDHEFEFAGRRYPINNPKSGKGCFVGILEKVCDQLTATLDHHVRVFVGLQVYHVNEYSEDNELFSKYIQKLKKRLKQRFKVKDIGYVWVREHGEREAPHYHLALFLDGNKVRAHHGVFKLAADIWTGWDQPHPTFPPKKSYYNLKKDDELNDVIYHLSYMAKVRTKERKPITANRFDGSRIKHPN